MGALALRPADLRVFDGQARLADVRIAEALGFDRPRDIRKLIRRNMSRLERHGEIFSAQERLRATVARSRATTAYYLNERQAYRLCMWSEAPNADAVQEQMVEVFVAWRHGQLVPAASHEVVLPTVAAKLSVMADRLEQLERVIASNAVRQAEGYALALAHFPVAKCNRKPAFWSDVEVRIRAVNWHRQMSVREAIEKMKAEIGRAPSKSALARFWLWMDVKAGRGIGRETVQ